MSASNTAVTRDRVSSTGTLSSCSAPNLHGSVQGSYNLSFENTLRAPFQLKQLALRCMSLQGRHVKHIETMMRYCRHAERPP